MSEGVEALTEKEKQTLRLIGRGHDAKSSARLLSLSVHTMNERLRAARRKLEVSSSRAAARRLLDAEGPHQTSVDKQLGDAGPPSGMRSRDDRAWHRRAWIIGGVLIVSLILAALALTLSPAANTPPTKNASVDSTVAAEVTRSAQAWLTLVDQGRWDDSWNASGQQFRQATTSRSWTDLIEPVRRPLGKVTSRTAMSHANVAQPPRSYVVVRFRTSFANKPAAIETVSMEREGREWKVVGYWIA